MENDVLCLILWAWTIFNLTTGTALVVNSFRGGKYVDADCSNADLCARYGILVADSARGQSPTQA